MILHPQPICKTVNLVKITNKGATGNLFPVNNEILFIDWENGSKEGFYAIDKTLQLRQIDKHYFATKTVGAYYGILERQLPLAIENYSITKSDHGHTFCSYYQEGVIHGFDSTGKKIFEWTDDIGQGHTIHDIRFEAPHFLWLTFPTGHTVTKLSLKSKKEVFRIGEYSWRYEEFELFNYPESLWIDQNFLYIPNMGNHKVYKMNLLTYHLSEEITLDIRPWQYLKCALGTFVVSDKGIYHMTG